MNLHKLFYSAFLVVALSSVIAGCATLGKCSLAGCAEDATITNKVRDLLDQHPELGAPGSIEVQTFDRVVYLNGLVATDLDVHIAESVALEARGVRNVVNSVAAEN